MSKWRKTLHRHGAVEDSERFVKESEEPFTPGDVESLKNSEHAHLVIKNIAEMADGNPVSKKQFTEIRDYLLTTPILHNVLERGLLRIALSSSFKAQRRILKEIMLYL